MFYRGLGISQTTVKYQIIAGAFICFSHLTDQVAIWDRRLIHSSQKSGMKMSQTSPASRWKFWHPSGQYLSSASEVVAAEETINPTSAHSKLLISAVMVAYICFSIALIILRDTLSWRARLLITHPCMFISGSSLAFFLPPPGSLTLLLSSSDSSVLFFRQSLTPLGSTEKRLAAASPEFSSACFTAESLNFKPYFLFFCSSSDSYYVAMEMDTILPQTWRSNILSNESGVLSCWFEHGLNVLLTNQIAWSELLVV